jgi:hypothetical protein
MSMGGEVIQSAAVFKLQSGFTGEPHQGFDL